jgi:hypothetical protein
LSHGSKRANKNKRIRKNQKNLNAPPRNSQLYENMENVEFNYEEVQAYMQKEIVSTEQPLAEITAAISDEDKGPATAPVGNGDTHDSSSDSQDGSDGK